MGWSNGGGYGGGQLRKRYKVEEGNARAQRRAGDDGIVNVQLGVVGQRYDR